MQCPSLWGLAREVAGPGLSGLSSPRPCSLTPGGCAPGASSGHRRPGLFLPDPVGGADRATWPAQPPLQHRPGLWCARTPCAAHRGFPPARVGTSLLLTVVSHGGRGGQLLTRPRTPARHQVWGQEAGQAGHLPATERRKVPPEQTQARASQEGAASLAANTPGARLLPAGPWDHPEHHPARPGSPEGKVPTVARAAAVQWPPTGPRARDRGAPLSSCVHRSLSSQLTDT